MATAIDRLTEEGHPQPGLYELLKEALTAQDDGAAGALPELWFKLRLVEVLGYRPELASCVVCGQTHDEYLFSATKGGIVCSADADATAAPFDNSSIKFWRILSDHPYTTASRIGDGTRLAQATLGLCDQFYEHHLGRAFLQNS
jgi:DNA repair protein RecO (recombination protein O)